MRQAKVWLVLVVLAAFAVIVFAPAAFAGAMPPVVTLKGPSSVNLNANFKVSGTVKNTSGGKGSKFVTIQKKSGSAWQIIKQVQAKWLNNKGIFSTTLKATNPTMSLIRYRAVWASGGVNGYSKTLVIAVQ